MNQQLFFLDTETTSADTTKARVVQMAIIGKPLTDDSKDYLRCEWTVKPSGEMEIGAIATHHITPRMVEWLPLFKDSDWYDALKRRLDLGHILVAHNAPYDVAVLANDGVVVERSIDTLKVAKHILDDSWIESFSLQYLRYFYKLDDLHEWELTSWFAHSALYDTIVLKWFYEFLEDRLKKLHPGQDPIERMLELSTLPILIKTLKFWKYQWRSLEEISRCDRWYLDWLHWSESKKPMHEQNKDLLHSLNHYLKL